MMRSTLRYTATLVPDRFS